MFFMYFLLWIIFNGSITVEICVIGAVVAGVIFWFTCKFMDYSIEKEIRNYKNIGKIIRYVALLLIEIVKANIGVLHLIITQKEEIEPVLVSFETDLETPAGKAFLANAITLTPGTITVSLEENEYVVHCLDETLAEGLDDTEFARRIKEMEGGAHHE